MVISNRESGQMRNAQMQDTKQSRKKNVQKNADKVLEHNVSKANPKMAALRHVLGKWAALVGVRPMRS